MLDPYVYPGTNVLRNIFDIKDVEEFAKVEYSYTFARRLEMLDTPIRGHFDFTHLLAIHKHLFQDLFDWAGQVRTVAITKNESVFYTGRNFDIPTTNTFQQLHDSSLLKGKRISDDEFAKDIAILLSNLNYIHPFREGNGRTQRTFLDLVAEQSGRTLTWRNITDIENDTLSNESVVTGSSKPMQIIIEKVMQPPHDGLSFKDSGAYNVIPFSELQRDWNFGNQKPL